MNLYGKSKNLILSAGALSLLALGTGMPNAMAARLTAPTSITVAYMANMGGASTLAVAEHMGYFKKAGLNVHLDLFQTGPAELDAMASGTVNIAYIGSGAAFLPMKGMAKIFFIDSIGLGDGIVVSKSSGVHTLRQLKGKSVLLPMGTTAEIILYEALKKAGLSLNDVHMVNTSPSSEAPAFLSGRAPIMAGWDPNLQVVLNRSPGSKLLASDRMFYPQVSLPGIWTASNAFAKSNVPALTKFTWAMLQAVNYKSGHMAQAVSWTSQMTGVPGPLLSQSVKDSIFPTESNLLKYYTSGNVSKWFNTLGSTFVAMKALQKVPAYASYAFPDLVLRASKLKL
ncbi:ABC transporter substrate-binding protein [Ferroacidibacillus organovorans]|uniref:SsuA/THI5-like domain-containing protein n=1 Tax=Ferroacidibacillus organovorans TaxID=1765683 RepID=A0A853K996_9BACL|nr:ABC transporter substrate-binding protein [Ferroacidibacillus organovorans]KYP79228.1 hypothetical protein AYJ22_15380 [Ferroacidibacillus organovorans]OAG93407.1 hypothetical protein AYW79_10720 [Ferroacidibacillus organovorans]